MCDELNKQAAEESPNCGSDEDRFRELEGLPGRIFVPCSRGRKKHPCGECFECQWCSDTRCTACRGEVEAQPGPGDDQATKR
jgi:hypothetical protein